VFSTIADFCAFHAKRKKAVVERGKVRKIGLGRWWINHEHRRQFSGIVYAPRVSAKITNGKLNLWNGFGCTARPGKCDLYLTHLQDNICNGNEGYFEYLLNWMSYAVQHPDRQGEVAVVMCGKEGTGKGAAAKQFGQLLGPHFLHIVHAKHLIGHFARMTREKFRKQICDNLLKNQLVASELFPSPTVGFFKHAFQRI
jgi:hypothetical protein